MTDPTNSEFKRNSTRINSIEKRRLELEVNMYEKAKRTMAMDMRKAQSEYKHRLHFYRDRQREIMMSRSNSSPSTASVGEFLLQRLRSRRSASPRGKTATRGDRSSQDINSVQRNLPKLQDSRPRSTKSRAVDSPHSSNAAANGLTCPTTGCAREQEHSLSRASTPRSPSCSPRSDPQVSGNRHRSATAPVRRDMVRPRTSSILKSRHPFSAVLERPKTSSASVKILETCDTWQSNPRSHQSFSGADKDSIKSATTHQETINDLEPLSLEDDSQSLGEFEAEEELGRISNRQRSKLDLRPSTAWSRLHGPGQEGRQRSKSEPACGNPFSGMTGHLGEPWRQVRYFDEDEIEERGLFYRLLLKDRLEREQTRFQDISAKVQAFCETPETSYDQANRRSLQAQNATAPQQQS